MPMPEYMQNPLFHMGLGLMSVPNQSYAPGAVSWGPGIQRGLLGYQQSLLYQDEQEERRQQQEFRQRKMEWEMQRQQQAQAQAAAQAQAREQWLASQDPAMQSFGAAFPGQLGKIAAQQFETSPEPTSALGIWMAQNPGKSIEDYWSAQTAVQGKRGNSLTVMPGAFGGAATFKPGTNPGKLVFDLENMQRLREDLVKEGRPTDVVDQGINNLRQALSTQPKPGAEQQRTTDRLKLVRSFVTDFIKTAKESGNTGPVEGRVRLEASDWGITTEKFAELKAKEATMRSFLGTALSGAAIPETEWPTYQAQVPAITDPMDAMTGKAKNFDKLVATLDLLAAAKRNADPAEYARLLAELEKLKAQPTAADSGPSASGGAASLLTPEEQALVDKWGG